MLPPTKAKCVAAHCKGLYKASREMIKKKPCKGSCMLCCHYIEVITITHLMNKMKYTSLKKASLASKTF